MTRTLLLLIAITGFSISCAPDLSQRRATATTAMTLLSNSRFEEAGTAAQKILDTDEENPFAAIVLAITRYKETMHRAFIDGQAVVIGGALSGQFSSRMLQIVATDADRGLAEVERLIDIAAAEPEFSIDLCVACMEVDWNRNGEVDDRDRVVLQVELDGNGQRFDENDPRRRPVFRFDYGDVLWAGAFVSFQRALLNLLSAYDLEGLGPLFRGREHDDIVLKLAYPERIALMRTLLLKGLSLSKRSRLAYLAETDDEREWLPNPYQKNHPLPMPVDKALYDTWEVMVTDLERIIRGDEGLSVAELAQLGDHAWRDPPGGYLNIGEMLENPKDIRFNPENLDDGILSDREDIRKDSIESSLIQVFGNAYERKMDASPIISRLLRMKNEIDRGHESLERKLRYLFWIN